MGLGLSLNHRNTSHPQWVQPDWYQVRRRAACTVTKLIWGSKDNRWLRSLLGKVIPSSDHHHNPESWKCFLSEWILKAVCPPSAGVKAGSSEQSKVWRHCMWHTTVTASRLREGPHCRACAAQVQGRQPWVGCPGWEEDSKSPRRRPPEEVGEEEAAAPKAKVGRLWSGANALQGSALWEPAESEDNSASTSKGITLLLRARSFAGNEMLRCLSCFHRKFLSCILLWWICTL